MLVRDIMCTQVETCAPDDSLTEAALLMTRFDCGSLPVVESSADGRRKLIGIITDRDIACRCVATGKSPNTTRVAECMSSPVVSLQDDASIEECCRRLEERQIRRIPVVDGSGNCQGIVAQADIARTADYSDIVLVLRRVSEPTAQL